ncbi:hypothetical protein SGFS_041720 [Streptomyces graminofaciens]|uniref:Uncharacterized protein n=1 Tax=Streptomyces graminofaciens TaxID=68212 RepID=A0ABM7FA87_9ACTN|nr:hypothetical protein SGFS_041720 [Streptomyces graminofaciens]
MEAVVASGVEAVVASGVEAVVASGWETGSQGVGVGAPGAEPEGPCRLAVGWNPQVHGGGTGVGSWGWEWGLPAARGWGPGAGVVLPFALWSMG